MTGRELVEAFVRESGSYIHRSELEELSRQADLFLERVPEVLVRSML